MKFGADRPRYVAGETVTVTARLLGKDMAPLTKKDVKVVARFPTDGDQATSYITGSTPYEEAIREAERRRAEKQQ